MSILKKNKEVLEKKINQSLDDTVIFISGMASSTIGIIELPYYSVPFPVDGSKLKLHKLGASEQFRHEVWIISGVKSNDDVMRGEETQLIGLISEKSLHTIHDSWYIFPGTHSKHMHVKDGYLVDFKTYMTGEFFNLLTKHSILKDSVEATDHTDALEHFKQGVKASMQNTLLHTVFSVRTNVLFDKLTKAENYFYLSGLLIGAELCELKNNPTTSVFMCSGSNLSLYYTAALNVLGLLEQTTVVDPQLMEEAAIRGQLKIYHSFNHENI